MPLSSGVDAPPLNVKTSTSRSLFWRGRKPSCFQNCFAGNWMMRGWQWGSQMGVQLEVMSQVHTCMARNFLWSIKAEGSTLRSHSSLPHSSVPFPRSGHMGEQLELIVFYEAVCCVIYGSVDYISEICTGMQQHIPVRSCPLCTVATLGSLYLLLHCQGSRGCTCVITDQPADKMMGSIAFIYILSLPPSPWISRPRYSFRSSLNISGNFLCC